MRATNANPIVPSAVLPDALDTCAMLKAVVPCCAVWCDGEDRPMPPRSWLPGGFAPGALTTAVSLSAACAQPLGPHPSNNERHEAF